MKQTLLVKTGWSDDYHDEPASGDFGHLLTAGDGSERFNFTALGRQFFGYSTGKKGTDEHGHPPTPRGDAHDWRVVFAARHPSGGIYIVGWYEGATLFGDYRDRPLTATLRTLIGKDRESIYCMVATTAYHVEPALRTLNISNGRFRNSGFYWLFGNGLDMKWTSEARLIGGEVDRLRRIIAPLPLDHVNGPDDLASTEIAGPQERDGKPGGRGGGESEEHRRLRLWARDNPTAIVPGLSSDAITASEFPLPSGDRVDAAYVLGQRAWMIEVKSHVSSDDDHVRGVYQCIKYREVYRAKEKGRCDVASVLVTERAPASHVRALLAEHGIVHVLAPRRRT